MISIVLFQVFANSQVVESSVVLSSLQNLGAIGCRRIQFNIDSEKYPSVAQNLGSKISQDGKVLFSNEVSTPIINLETGKLLWEERIRLGKRKGDKKLIIGTMSQWGHIDYQAGLSDAILEDMASINRWVGSGRANGKDRRSGFDVILADINPKSRSYPPNRQILIPEKYSFVAPAKGEFSAQFGQQNSIEYRVFAEGLNMQRHIESWYLPKGTSKLTKRDKDIKLPVVRGSEPRLFDFVHNRVIYGGGQNGEVFEWDCKSRRLIQIPKEIKTAEVWYWRGKLIRTPRRDETAKSNAVIFSDDRKSSTVLTPYIWIAKSSNERFALVKEPYEKSMWLVEFSSKK